MEYAISAAFGYLLGSIPFGLIIGYLWIGDDIRRRGSGKTGVTNVLRTAGRVPAALALLGDVLKGLAPALLGRFMFDSYGAAAAGSGAAIVGHVWPVFAGFRGGRGVATSFGGVLGLAPLIGLALPVLGALIVFPTRYVSLMSVVGTPIAALVIVVSALAGWVPGSIAWYALFATALILYMHLPNIRRLIAGTEPRLGQGGDQPATG